MLLLEISLLLLETGRTWWPKVERSPHGLGFWWGPLIITIVWG